MQMNGQARANSSKHVHADDMMLNCTPVSCAAVLQESDALQAELKLLQAERSALSREVALKQQLEAGWAARAGQQAAALKEAQAKAATLEQSLQQVLDNESSTGWHLQGCSYCITSGV
jgi:hypothetical protein